MFIEPSDLLGIVEEALPLLGIDQFTGLRITGAQKVGNTWRVNVSYTKVGGLFVEKACFSIDTTDGSVDGMWLGRQWK